MKSSVGSGAHVEENMKSKSDLYIKAESKLRKCALDVRHEFLMDTLIVVAIQDKEGIKRILELPGNNSSEKEFMITLMLLMLTDILEI